MEDAQTAAAKLMQTPEAEAFMSAINPSSVAMRHAMLAVTA
jgi:hypothetical protein